MTVSPVFPPVPAGFLAGLLLRARALFQRRPRRLDDVAQAASHAAASAPAPMLDGRRANPGLMAWLDGFTASFVEMAAQLRAGTVPTMRGRPTRRGTGARGQPDANARARSGGATSALPRPFGWMRPHLPAEAREAWAIRLTDDAMIELAHTVPAAAHELRLFAHAFGLKPTAQVFAPANPRAMRGAGGAATGVPAGILTTDAASALVVAPEPKIVVARVGTTISASEFAPETVASMPLSHLAPTPRPVRPDAPPRRIEAAPRSRLACARRTQGVRRSVKS